MSRFLLFLCIVASVGCEQGTYVSLEFRGLDYPLDRIDLQLVLNGKTDSASFSHRDRKIQLPENAVLNIVDGSGEMGITTIAYLDEEARAHASTVVEVVSGKTVKSIVQLGNNSDLPPPFDMLTAEVGEPHDLSLGDMSVADDIAVVDLVGVPPQPVHVALSLIDSAQGTVLGTAPSLPSIDCGATCDQTYPAGSVVTFSAVAASGYYFSGWTGDCSGDLLKCVRTVGPGPLNVTAIFSPANSAFVTSNTYTLAQIQEAGVGATPTEKTISGADAICRSVASQNQNFVAWMSSSSSSAISRIQSATSMINPRGWTRLDGKPFVDSLSQKKTLYPLALDESGAPCDRSSAPYCVAWSGTLTDGTLGGATCADWTSSMSSETATMGYFWSADSGWSDGAEGPCNTANRLICLGTKYHAVIEDPKLPMPSRVAFIAANGFDMFAGLAVADSLCSNAAAGAALPGSYKAVLAMPSASAASRFSIQNVPLVRPDGVVLGMDSDLLGTIAPVLAAGFTLANGEPWDFGVAAIGADDFASVGSESCSGWSSLSGNGKAFSHKDPFNGGINPTSVSCKDPCTGCVKRNVLCLQE